MRAAHSSLSQDEMAQSSGSATGGSSEKDIGLIETPRFNRNCVYCFVKLL